MKITLTFLFMMLIWGGYASQSADKGTGNTPLIREFVAGAELADSGFVNYYYMQGKHYLEIPDPILGRDILTAITILKGAQKNDRVNNNRFGYGGDAMNNKMIRFVKRDGKIDLVQPEPHYTTDKDAYFGPFYQSLIDPIARTFEVVAHSDSSSLIDITDFYLGDSEELSLAGASASIEAGGYIQGESYSEKVVSFPENINFRSVRCYSAADPEKSTYPKLLWEVGASWFLLPKDPMKVRLTDKRVGYFNTTLRGQLYEKSGNDLFDISNRWRLEPKPEDVPKYLNGELVEPAKPIIFYIDKTMPSFLVEGVKQAVSGWQTAFEKAGFKNAISARMEPTAAEDPDFSIEDARYSYISYKASPIPNAYGPMVVDPRSGEVICSHVAVFHSVMDLVQMWYFSQCGQSDPRARTYPLEHDLMGKLMNRVVTHEIGHTLGLRHNFLGSTVYAVDSLRSNSFLAKNGLGTSIMDYERYNYVAQPEDSIAPENLLPKIGAYDLFAIEWGYRYFADSLTAVDIDGIQKNWIEEQQKSGNCYFIPEETATDPRVQAEDCGDDVVYASELGMNNLQYLMKHLEEWSNGQDKDDYVLLQRRYYYVLHQYEAYMGHVLNAFGGYYTEDCSCGVKVSHTYHAVSAEQQKRAMDFVAKYFLNEPEWLLKPDFLNKVDFNYYERVEAPAMNRIALMISNTVNYSVSESIDPNSTSYEEIADFVYNTLFPEGEETDKTSAYRRMLQRDLLTQLSINVENPGNISYGVLQDLKLLLDGIQQYAQKGASSKDETTRVHYQSMDNFIKIWKTGNQNF